MDTQERIKTFWEGDAGVDDFFEYIIDNENNPQETTDALNALEAFAQMSRNLFSGKDGAKIFLVELKEESFQLPGYWKAEDITRAHSKWMVNNGKPGVEKLHWRSVDDLIAEVGIGERISHNLDATDFSEGEHSSSSADEETVPKKSDVVPKGRSLRSEDASIVKEESAQGESW